MFVNSPPEVNDAFLVDDLRRGLTLRRPLTLRRQRRRRCRPVVWQIFAELLLKPLSSF
jgi:hypothetical protein